MAAASSSVGPEPISWEEEASEQGYLAPRCSFPGLESMSRNVSPTPPNWIELN